MAARTSNGTGGGNWSSTATWSGGVVPVAGTDTVTIANGDTVNIDAGALTSGQLIIGSDPGGAIGSGTPALTIGSTSQTTETKVTTSGSTAIRLRGDLFITGQAASPFHFSTLALSATDSLIFDPPSGGQYGPRFTNSGRITGAGTTNTGLWPDTTGGNHVIVKTDLSRGGTAMVTYTPSGDINTEWFGGFTNFTFTEFKNCGTNATNTIGVYHYLLPTITHSGADNDVSFTNCTFDSSTFASFETTGGAAWAGNFTWSNNICSNSIVGLADITSGGISYMFHKNAGGGSANRVITNNGFDVGAFVWTADTLVCTFTGNVVAGRMISEIAHSLANATFNNNLVTLRADGQSLFPSMSGNWFVHLKSGWSNWGTITAGTTITKCILDSGVATAVATGFQGNSSGTGNIVLSFNIITPGVDGNGSGGLFMPWVNTTTFTVEHNLQMGRSSRAMCNLSRLVAAVAGQLVSCRANIIDGVGANANAFLVTETINATNTLDAITVSGYNGYTSPATGTVKTSAGGVTTNSVPLYNNVEVTAVGSPLSNGNTQIGFGDFSANPAFVDGTRTLAGWSTHVGGAGTYADGLARLAANPTLLASAIAWVLAGYVPTNTAYLHATYPGDAATTGADGLPLNGTVGPLGYPLYPFFIDNSLSGGFCEGVF